jgi:hypothetical protein
MCTTNKENAYLDEWISLIEKLKTKLGKDFRVIGFDPDVLCSYEGRSFTMPKEFVEELLGINKKNPPTLFNGYKLR